MELDESPASTICKVLRPQFVKSYVRDLCRILVA